MEVDAQGRVVAIAGSARDITEQKRVEKRLRESEAKYRLIAENMTDMISVIRTVGTFSYVSPSHQQILGYPEHVYYDKSCINLIHPDDRKRVKQDFDQMKKSKSFPVMEYRVKHSDGHWVDLESRFKPVLNRDGEIVSYLAVSRDVTQHKRTEELLRQSDKLSAIGQLAAGIAHEIRNPLTALRGFIQLMKSSESRDVRYCEIMLAELDRINFIVSELLMLAKPQVVKFQLKDMQEILQNVLSLLDTQAILNNIQIHTRLAEPQGGVITMEGSVREDGNVLIRISDSGCGISPDRIPKLGEPFYTTKEKGTGLGLMVSYKIIENHGGSIAISSVINQGTTVDVVLPAAAKRMEKGVLAVV
jgi:two-component system sporulation sensor kinase A